MNSPEFDVYRWYTQMPPSIKTTGKFPEGSDDEEEDHYKDVKYEVTYQELCDFLRSVPSIPEVYRPYLEGVSVMQFSSKPVSPYPFFLNREGVAMLAANLCYFRLNLCTMYWKKSRHKLNSFYVVSFRIGNNEKADILPDISGEAFKAYVRKQYCFYIFPWHEIWNFLNSARFGFHKEHYEGTCCIDYFTTGPWVDMVFDEELLSCFCHSMMDLEFKIHQNMKVDSDDRVYPVFNYIKRNKRMRNCINAEKRKS